MIIARDPSVTIEEQLKRKMIYLETFSDDDIEPLPRMYKFQTLERAIDWINGKEPQAWNLSNTCDLDIEHEYTLVE